ncbi:MAG: histidinol-phosphate transaminase [archaeon]
MVAFILVPKNSGLKEYSDKALEQFSDYRTIEARGEDIPLLVEQFSRKGRDVIGLTGEDLVAEYTMAGGSRSRILRRIPWNDPKARYGKPALCLIGNGRGLPRVPTVFISSKYRNIASAYLDSKGKFNKIFVNGCVEPNCKEGIADLIVDIVYTGASLERYGLRVLDVILKSDFLVIGPSPKPTKCVEGLPTYVPPTANRSGLRLDFNENTVGCSPKVVEAIRGFTSDTICKYPDYSAFRRELAQYLCVDESEVLMTNGTDEAIRLVTEAYLETGDSLVLVEPSFALYRIYAGLSGAKIQSVPLNDDMSFPIDELVERSVEAKMLIIANPNNPTGSVILEEDIVRLAETGVLLVVDEAYWQYYGKSAKELCRRYSNVIILQTFSKAFGLAGLRLGCAISDSAVIASLSKVLSPYSVNSLALVAGSAALKDAAFVEGYAAEVRKSRDYLRKELGMLGIRTYPSEANFVLADFGEARQKVYSELRAAEILVRDVSKYPMLAGCLRIGVGTMEQSEALVGELKKILRKKAVLFDMDGTLVDVSKSYRLAIQKTAEFFTGDSIAQEEIQGFKDIGGYNNDWDLTAAIIADRNVLVEKERIIAGFQDYYRRFRDDETLMFSGETIQRLYCKYRLGIVTGRPREEAIYTLERLGILQYFDVIVALGDYPPEKSKPDPCGIELAIKRIGCEAIYIGDTIDDQKAAEAAGIRVRIV